MAFAKAGTQATTSVTQTSLSVLEQYTWASPLAPAMEPDEYVFILSCLQPYVDMARLCRKVQREHQDAKDGSAHPIVMALSCMNQYELRRACHEWKAIIVHVEPECIALQRSIATHYNRYHIWAAIQVIMWGSVLTAVGLRQNNIIRNSRWPTSRLASAFMVALGGLLTASCISKTSEFIMAIPRGYDVVKVKNEEAGAHHLFLVRRDYTLKNNVRIVPMYLLSGLGLGTMLLGARIAFKVRRRQ
ncbi:hypothetical protein BG011_003660 [Mortierella polycephala]|uniref:Transmembrane protein n=1 Tax=Mortierella polycephala TaxID=41804 RepID=A0A9P6Q3K5_9FUNG|nr:hypothetical protein BG011_003660 [Mortierella polycephala]